MQCAGSPDWIGQSCKSVDGTCLCSQQDDGDFDDREIARFRENTERNDHGSRAGRRMIDVQQDHNGSGKRKCKSRGQNAGPIDFTAKSFRKGVHARHLIGSEAAQ